MDFSIKGSGNGRTAMVGGGGRDLREVVKGGFTTEVQNTHKQIMFCAMSRRYPSTARIQDLRGTSRSDAVTGTGFTLLTKTTVKPDKL